MTLSRAVHDPSPHFSFKMLSLFASLLIFNLSFFTSSSSSFLILQISSSLFYLKNQKKKKSSKRSLHIPHVPLETTSLSPSDESQASQPHTEASTTAFGFAFLSFTSTFLVESIKEQLRLTPADFSGSILPDLSEMVNLIEYA